MTDKAKELNELADWLESGGAGADFNRLADAMPDIVNALRLAATLEELWEGNGTIDWLFGEPRMWRATFEGQDFEGATPLEAMRAAIDAAKPCSHLFPKAGDGWVFLEDEGYWGRNCKRCGLLETADRLVPAKEGE